MATIDIECIRLQARARLPRLQALRATAHSCRQLHRAHDFPVGCSRELVPAAQAARRLATADDDLARLATSRRFAEIREENPEADEREVELRVAIRESIGMTRDEEDAA